MLRDPRLHTVSAGPPLRARAARLSAGSTRSRRQLGKGGERGPQALLLLASLLRHFPKHHILSCPRGKAANLERISSDSVSLRARDA
jgi:hypothetical protein